MKKFLLARIQSFKCAFAGLAAVKSEVHMRIHVLIALSAIVIGLIQEINACEWLLIIGCIGLVLMAEIFNTAIEKTINYISLDKNPEAKVIKDISAAAVLISAITASIIGSYILFF